MLYIWIYCESFNFENFATSNVLAKILDDYTFLNSYIFLYMLYSGKFWRRECLVNLLFSSASEVITVLMSSVQKLFCYTEKPIIT